jgi:hypothetical protein
MTRQQMEQVRDALKECVIQLRLERIFPTAVDGQDALAILDAELARPEVREWRVSYPSWRGMERSRFASLCAAQSFASHQRSKCSIESRTPAGPWEAEV